MTSDVDEPYGRAIMLTLDHYFDAPDKTFRELARQLRRVLDTKPEITAHPENYVFTIAWTLKEKVIS